MIGQQSSRTNLTVYENDKMGENHESPQYQRDVINSIRKDVYNPVDLDDEFISSTVSGTYPT